LRVSNDGLTLTGETYGPVVDGIRKAELLDVIAQAESVSPEQVIAVGDGANDLFMLSKAGLGIAFNAKPRVQQQVSWNLIIIYYNIFILFFFFFFFFFDKANNNKFIIIITIIINNYYNINNLLNIL